MHVLPPLSFNLFFDDVLSKNKVNRRRAGKECKRGNGLGQRRLNKCLDDRYDWRDVQHHWWLGYLHSYMCSGAEWAVRVGDVPLRMNVNDLNRAASNDQRDAQQREEKPPRTLHLRS